VLDEAREVIEELTFDTTLEISATYRDLFARSRCIHQVGTCWYVGSPRSGWQLRIYQRTSEVTRIEFVLRPKALRVLHIWHACDILKLRTADIWHLVNWRQFDPIRTSLMIGQRASGPAIDICLSLQRRSMRHLDSLLRREYRVQTEPLLKPSPIQELLEKMQGRLTW
jgi:hypothetical protein